VGFLPYGGGGPGAWTGSFAASVTTHAAMVLGLYALYEANPIAPEIEERAAFTVTLETLDTDTLAGTLLDDEATGTEPVETDAVEAETLAPEEVETAALEAAEPEALQPENPEETAPEGTPDSIEAVEAEALDAETVETPEPEIAEAPEPETVEGLVPDDAATAETPEPETVEGLVPDESGTADALVPETFEGLAPEGSVAVAVDADAAALASTVIEPVAPIVDAASASPIAPISESSPITPDIASPIVPDGVGTVAALGGGAAGISPVAPAGGGAVAVTPNRTTTLAPASPQTGPDRVASVTRPPAGQPAPVPASTRPPPTEQDLALADLIARIRALPGEACLIALPRRDGETGIGLALVSGNEAAMEGFAQSLLGPGDEDIRQTRTLVDGRQCAALDYIRANGDYPATRMGIRADALQVASGENLTGVLRGAAGRYLTLLIVDDNGVVQDLQRFTSFSSNLARFDVPVTRAGASRDTEQLLLAIATTRPPEILRERAGRLAEDVFAGLPDDMASGAALGVASFDVR